MATHIHADILPLFDLSKFMFGLGHCDSFVLQDVHTHRFYLLTLSLVKVINLFIFNVCKYKFFNSESVSFCLSLLERFSFLHYLAHSPRVFVVHINYMFCSICYLEPSPSELVILFVCTYVIQIHKKHDLARKLFLYIMVVVFYISTTKNDKKKRDK